MLNEKFSLAKSLIDNASRIAIVSHIRPDGDAIGSLLGLGLGLEILGKEVQFVLQDTPSKSFIDVPKFDQIKHSITSPVDLIISTDASDMERIGTVFSEEIFEERTALNQPLIDINIDHHPTNTNFGQVNIVNSEAVAASIIVYQFLRYLGIDITKPIAETILSGIITDTLGLRTQNMNSEALRIAAELVDFGADISSISFKLMAEKKLNAIKLWGLAINKINYKNDILWATLRIADKKQAKYLGNDDADLINLLSSIKESNVAICFIEQPNDEIKVSWRAKKGYDVSRVALCFGGGGHVPAAGATVSGDFEESVDRVLAKTVEFMKEDQEKNQSDS